MAKYESLVLPEENLGPLARPRRLAAITEAVSWPSGSREARTFTSIYSFPDLGYEVGVEKPGKESFETRNPNKNDMWPVVRQHGRHVELPASFLDLYVEIEKTAKSITSHEPMHLLGCMLYRSSYMLDHTNGNHWRWKPPSDVLDDFVAAVPHMGGLPSIVYLHLVEVIALQEDVKYWTLQREIKGGVGRVNNLQTCAHLIATCLGKVMIMKFAGELSRAGLAPIPQKKVRILFPLLGPMR